MTGNANHARSSPVVRRTARSYVGRWLAAAVVVGVTVESAAFAAERYAVVVIGAAGEPKYVESYNSWRATLVSALTGRLGFPADHVKVLAERGETGVERSTSDQIRKAFADLKSRLQPEDLCLVVLIGHGTFDGETAKFNIIGPDIDQTGWSALVRGLSGQLVVVDTTGASFPFLQSLAAPGRIVVTATDSVAQRYETVFPEYFIDALDNEGADADKNGRISVWEAFQYASVAVRQWYEQKGQLSTERSLLDDTGDGLGKEAGAPGPDGALARSVFLDAEATALGADGELAALNRRRALIEQQIEALKARKSTMSQEDFDEQFEKLATELAKVSREIRSRS